MNFLLVIPHYISWHYTKGVIGLISLCKDFAGFIWNFFSVQLLLKTLITPFKRLDVKARNKFNLADFFSALVTNIIMRVVGMVLRTFFIVSGLFVLILFMILFGMFFIIWFLLPFILLAMLVGGIIAMFKIPQI